MDAGKMTLNYLKTPDLSNELTKISINKSLISTSNTFSQSRNKSPSDFSALLENIKFFNRPDIIPYPFDDHKNSSPNPPKTPQQESAKNLNKSSKEKNPKKSNSNKPKTRQKSILKSRNKFDWQSDCLECETCVRLHHHKWAVIRS